MSEPTPPPPPHSLRPGDLSLLLTLWAAETPRIRCSAAEWATIGEAAGILARLAWTDAVERRPAR